MQVDIPYMDPMGYDKTVKIFSDQRRGMNAIRHEGCTTNDKGWTVNDCTIMNYESWQPLGPLLKVKLLVGYM